MVNAALLEAGSQGSIPVQQMDAALQTAGRLRRCVEQAAKATRMLTEVAEGTHRDTPEGGAGNQMVDHD